MTLRSRILLGVTAAALLAAAGCFLVRPSGPGLQVGQAAPDFALQGSDGKVHRLSDSLGKRAVVVAWFPKALTGGWSAECTSLRESGDAIRAFEADLYGASIDDADTSREFAGRLGLDFPLLSDPTKETARAWGVLNPLGLAARITVYVGKDGRVLLVDGDGETSAAGAAVARRLGELGVERSSGRR
jgi:peroxiredoxin Q/BCP